MLAPVWFHVSSGALRKGGIRYQDYFRKIALLGNFRRDLDSISGMARMGILLMAERLGEPLRLDQPPPTMSGRKLFVFSGDQNFFADLYGQASGIHSMLRTVTATRWLATVDAHGEIPIALNVRRGKDFSDATSESEFFTHGALRTPLQWFIDALREIRTRLGAPSARAYVVSDGTERDLQPLLMANNVHLVQSRSAVSDLLILAKARLLIGSGGSSFRRCPADS